jgi:hypothetical protein
MSSTTAILLNIVNDLRSSKACAEEAKGAEKARIGHLLDEAKRLFEVCIYRLRSCIIYRHILIWYYFLGVLIVVYC